ncbi:glutathione S-transferase [Pseudomonas sp. MM211]|uniref:glutathione S-transferase family protein n=1 Tax=Pseudomonas sp. MM211 TaxID=2866808 RepID=UPI001CED000B|nr:glutathione S-transferase [Pseudomonas sp. MM211]UCJ18061.1 glutathione S-transferase [Pseudomonas sp. MM211]
MLRLHGFAVSNYYNMVKLALLEKGLPFEEVRAYACREQAFLAISPRGKVPVLECDEGFISETSAILEYLEALGQGTALLPQGAFEQAKARELARHIELYIELPARYCYAQAFFGMQLDPAILKKGREELLAGVDSLKRLGVFSPYVAGDSMSLADLYFLYSIDLAAAVAHKLFEIDLLADFSEARALLERFATNPNVQRVAADKEAAFGPFMAHMKARVAG